jgi:mRNA interferase HigB
LHIISRKALVKFWTKHPDAKSALLAWHAIAKRASWKRPQDVKNVFRSASFLENNVVVFEIGGRGKGYRLSVGMDYSGIGRVYIRDVLTHDEYLNQSREGTL